ncbi:MAG TPA: glycogen debranching protein GlgX [Anaerolineae bacterium]|nr:glycogen debranching protein GlgX [Anaerolineae bacterium]HQH39979.1 glycogen debranching protein GlgX [Anaerolineae bacterium]
MELSVHVGQSFPLGATVYPWGVNFSVFSKNCDAVELLFFDDVDAAQPAQVIHLDPHKNRTFYYWHAFVRGIGPGQLYGYRVHGPFAPEKGLRFDGTKVLLDPYTRAVAIGANYDREAAKRPGDNAAHALKSVVVDPHLYDWEDDWPLDRSYTGTVIYEMHVGGFTRHPSSGVAPHQRGTYAGVIEKIPYLQSLGVTAVELLPVQQFDPQDAPPGLSNYWGYSPVAFFAPHQGYCHSTDPLEPVKAFRDMVKALHRAGIEVILDVAFNHTAENDHNGPTLSFRGLENRAYYILDRHNPARYADYSGVGNTVNANHSIVRRMIMDCLHYWVAEMHVDGFRFDLAAVMSRGERGGLLEDPPILWEIESDPVLAGTKIIAEAWDAAGLYQLGSFVGHRWAEWNGQFRDDVRRFVKGDEGTVERLSKRIAGSPDLFPQENREPNRSINFVTCHDGFTLNDVVSYNMKHNEANLEHNLDGTDVNFSWNCGVEGPTLDPEVQALRLRQIKNFITILFFSQGTPMVLMGDEVRRTQCGNNNAYSQDNEISWLDWRHLEQHAGVLRFVQNVIAFTQSLSLLRQECFLTENGGNEAPTLTWHGVQLYTPDWMYYSHSLAFELYHPDNHEHLHVMLNAYWEPLTFTLPAPRNSAHWRRIIDTNQPTPDDFCAPDAAPVVETGEYRVAPRSSVVLLAREP